VSLAFSPASTAATALEPIRVMVVDDAVVVRSMLGRWIEEEADLRLVGSLRNGREAIDEVERIDPDVVVLDLDMPELDGISALPLLLQKKRDLVVIIASALTRRDAEISLKALSLGAADSLPKPSLDPAATAEFRRELIEKIRALGARYKRRKDAARLRQPVIARAPSIVPALPSYKLRPFAANVPRVLTVGASTGGPQALTTLLTGLKEITARTPVLITQHMPPTFTTILAEHLSRASGRSAREPLDGEPILAGNIYVAPGGRHMSVTRRNGTAVIVLDDGPPINFCRPAVDPLFSSAAETWGNWVLGLLLTGMGADGKQGATDIVAAGGSVMAQDEATSVIWGMPGAVAEAGLCSAVLPLDRIAPKIVRLFLGGRS
jgi:two-component system, chemotaxis family, protein-glutamate methylesterase/glutaminase